MRLIIINILIFLTITGCSQQRLKDIDLLEAVPQNTSFVIQVNDTLDLANSSLLMKIFALHPSLKKTIKNITPKNPSLPFVYSITTIGKDQKTVSFVTKSIPADTLIKYETEINYSGQTIGSITKGTQNLYIAQFGNLKMIAESKLLIENGIRNYVKKIEV